VKSCAAWWTVTGTDESRTAWLPLALPRVGATPAGPMVLSTDPSVQGILDVTEQQRIRPGATMTSVTLHLDCETERRLREQANLAGQTLEVYLAQLAEHAARQTNGTTASTGSLGDEEFDRLLDELATGPTLPHLPGDFSRAEVYADHD
jgi:hypothetical protein